MRAFDGRGSPPKSIGAHTGPWQSDRNCQAASSTFASVSSPRAILARSPLDSRAAPRPRVQKNMPKLGQFAGDRGHDADGRHVLRAGQAVDEALAELGQRGARVLVVVAQHERALGGSPALLGDERGKERLLVLELDVERALGDAGGA